ncbi:glycosyltransferase family 2 protein [Peniophora sp. CONT]|nr:glycosyltransferase family 2 protein [Peniophora sp. CONT]
MAAPKPLFVVTGGLGFIGSHIARRLLAAGNCVRIVDIKKTPDHPVDFPRAHPPDLVTGEDGNLCDRATCDRVVQGAHTVLHLAANMGGMGAIHLENDTIIYEENANMTRNIFFACRDAGVKRFFYASSACVYPDSLQRGHDVSLKESDAYAPSPPTPQGLYGLEKLQSEQLLLASADATDMDIRIARFHNVYGPGGSFNDGREKVPAAMLRKALAISLGADTIFEIWGDGTQRRSFIYIEDCLDAIFLLLESDHAAPVNIGTERSVSMQELASIALRCAHVEDGLVRFDYDIGKPLGVAARNSDNTLAHAVLGGWMPALTLENGMQQTARWIRSEMEKSLRGLSDSARHDYLHNCQTSRMVRLEADCITYGILLPITSRGASGGPTACLDHLRTFAKSLVRTTRHDIYGLGGTRFQYRVYLAIDHDDAFLFERDGSGHNKAEVVLRAEGVLRVNTLDPPPVVPRGHVCELWRLLARRAMRECDYLVLMGDDVELLDEGWMRQAHNEFVSFSGERGVPPGFGCVAFTDVSFPGMPTFPIISALHMRIFDGLVVPSIFVNQDGDPFLYQLYRRWGCSRMMPSRLHNAVGGGGDARYEKQSAKDWTFSTLTDATARVERWLADEAPSAKRLLTLDVVVPSYRVQIDLLARILELRPSCTTMFIVIVDDPTSASTAELERRFAARPDVRIRTNKSNEGASASRNRGLRESAAEWVFFLDDDVRPDENILVEAERAIRTHPTAAGFVGNVRFPRAETVFTAAVHLAGVLFFWDIAAKWEEWGKKTDVPWGVTAALIARRDVQDGVQYDLSFPKTGGGEDIDYCRRKRAALMNDEKLGFMPAPQVCATHPWWSGGARSYWRFYMWSVGDGQLIAMYPDLAYRDFTPNSAELFLLAACAMFFGALPPVAAGDFMLLQFGIGLALSVFGANVTHDLYRHLWRDVERYKDINTDVGGVRWAMAAAESSVLRMFSEAGRTVGIIQRGEYVHLGKRFDWFAGRLEDGPRREERKNGVQRFALVGLFLGVLYQTGLVLV